MYNEKMTKKTKYILILAAVLCLVLLGGTRFLASRSQGQVLPVLMYHDLCQDTETPGRYAVTASRFRQDMEWLRDNGYTPMTAADLVAAKQAGSLPKKPVMITFDDGYKSNYTIAMPILQDTGMKATVCIIGTLIEEGRTGYMTMDDAKAAQASGVIDLQSHTYNLHGSMLKGDWPYYGSGIYRLENESQTDYIARLSADVEKNKALLEELGSELTLFAYPFGHCDPWSVDVMRSYGVEVTLFTGNRLMQLGDDLYGLTRLEVTTEKSVEAWLG